MLLEQADLAFRYHFPDGHQEFLDGKRRFHACILVERTLGVRALLQIMTVGTDYFYCLI